MKKRSKNKSKKFRLPFSWIRNTVIVVFVVFVAVVVCRETSAFFLTSNYFAVKEIVLDESVAYLKSNKLSRIKGKNLFSVDLNKLQKDLQYRYPEVFGLKISRRFPDQIFIFAQRRTPVAQIKIRNQNVLLDQDGVVLPSKLGDGLELPMIMGIQTDGLTAKLGSRLRFKDIHLGLKILKIFREEDTLVSYRIDKLDVSNVSKIHFYLSPHLEVIVDKHDLSRKMQSLGLVLANMTSQIEEVRYIDLRFQEPVLGKK